MVGYNTMVLVGGEVGTVTVDHLHLHPAEAGLAVGGPGFSPHVMLEVHYNNQNMEQG